jgi:hypothetical protein
VVQQGAEVRHERRPTGAARNVERATESALVYGDATVLSLEGRNLLPPAHVVPRDAVQKRDGRSAIGPANLVVVVNAIQMSGWHKVTSGWPSMTPPIEERER